MDKFQAMTVFIAVAEEAGFAAAGRRLSMSPPAVTRVIAALEKDLGAVLFLRTTRQVRLTDTGEQFLVDARRIINDVSEAEATITGKQSTPQGELVVTAPAMFGRLHITPLINQFLQTHDKVTVRAIFLDRVTSLLEEGIDLGVRIGELPDSNLRAVRLGSVRLKTFAAPDYLKQFSRPRSIQALHKHRLIVSTAGNLSSVWRFEQQGKVNRMKIKPVLTCNTNDAAIAAAAQGLGITRVLSYQASTETFEGKLTPILEKFDGPMIPVNLVHIQGRNVPAKVRAFIEMAKEAFQDRPLL